MWYNKTKKWIKGLGEILKKLSEKQKNQNLSRAKKEHRRRRKIKANKHNSLCVKKRTKASKFQKANHTVVAPSHLSFTDYYEETMRFFNNLSEVVVKCSFNDMIYFDLSSIVYLTEDAIMYLLASFKTRKKIANYNIRCSGNVPCDSNIARLLEQAGFFQHVYRRKNMQSEIGLDRVQIHGGNNINPELAAKICDFTKDNANDSINTKSLYAILIELMTNTKQHAYDNDISTLPNWYAFCKKDEQSIKLVFLDTGVGIPQTINKNFTEKIKMLISLNKAKHDFKHDAGFTESALLGAFRTETKEAHRGKGLPEIYSYAQEPQMRQMSIFSGHGLCRIANTGIIEKTNLESTFKGRLFFWEFNKEGV